MDIEDIRSQLDQPTSPDEEVDEEQENEEGEAASEAENEEEESEVEESTEEEDSETDVERDTPRVPYSRFESVNERAIRAEEELRILKESQQHGTVPANDAPVQLPSYWVKLYGDSDASKEAFQLRQQELKETRQELYQSLREEMEQEREQEEARTEELVDDWSAQIDDFAATHKRKFTDTQTDALLDVMDELTPKDSKGNYLVEPISLLPQAVELYDLRQERASAKKKQSKQATTRLTAARGEGTLTTPSQEWDGNWEKKLTKMGL